MDSLGRTDGATALGRLRTPHTCLPRPPEAGRPLGGIGSSLNGKSVRACSRVSAAVPSAPGCSLTAIFSWRLIGPPPHPGSFGTVESAEVGAVERDRAFVWIFEADQQAQQRRLAAPGASGDDVERAAPEGGVDAVEDERARIRLADAGEGGDDGTGFV